MKKKTKESGKKVKNGDLLTLTILRVVDGKKTPVYTVQKPIDLMQCSCPLCKACIGKEEGDVVEVPLERTERDEELVFLFPKQLLPDNWLTFNVGEAIMLEKGACIILAVKDEGLRVDMNDPNAGHDVTLTVTIKKITTSQQPRMVMLGGDNVPDSLREALEKVNAGATDFPEDAMGNLPGGMDDDLAAQMAAELRGEEDGSGCNGDCGEDCCGGDPNKPCCKDDE
jgi:FKBP-type peptidyl-prolyl cis-trans isomerase 2